MNSRWLRACVATVLVATHSHAAFAAQAQGNDEIVERATRYVLEFFQRFSSVVAEERYVQETTNPFRVRELKSDFLLVTPPGSTDWFQFRDVFEVDGRQVKDREDRLAKLFFDTPIDTTARATQLRRENARYNLEDVGTLNMPLIAIGLLQPRYREGFRFTPRRIEPQYGADVWVVDYMEHGSPTVLRRFDGHDMPARGRIWISENTGLVVRTELLFDNGPFTNEIRTLFRYSDDFEIGVPVEMRENYALGNNQMTGVATYGRFRRFSVQSEEVIQEPPQPTPPPQSPKPQAR